MKTILPFFVVLMWASTSFGQDLFSNLREGKSRFITEKDETRVTQTMLRHGRSNLESKFHDIFQDKNVATCASTVVSKLSKIEKTRKGRETLALAARELNIIDDIALDIILKRNNVKFEGSFPAMQTGSIETKKIEKPFKSFKKKIADGYCPEDAYFSLVSSMYGAGYKKNGKLKAANSVAKKKGFISKKEYELLESFRRAKVHMWPLSLKQYSRKLNSVRRQIDGYGLEEGNFVTKENKKAKMSLRQYIYSNFSYLQIIMMGNIVEKMRKRLDSIDISIIIRYADDEQTEIIPLEPTERFRFVLKLLRKEMAKLNQSTLFENRNAHYAAVIAASYETGAVPAIELEELASLEEIWNPNKTRMDRIMAWARMFGGVASVVIPGPFAFLPVLTVMVVDGIVTNPKPTADQDISLF